MRDVELHRVTLFALPAAPYLTCNASLSEDGKRLSLMVVNRNVSEPITARVELAPFAAAAEGTAWTLNGPAVDATNETDAETVGLSERQFAIADQALSFTFPAHSFTALVVPAR